MQHIGFVIDGTSRCINVIGKNIMQENLWCHTGSEYQDQAGGNQFLYDAVMFQIPGYEEAKVRKEAISRLTFNLTILIHVFNNGFLIHSANGTSNL